MVPGQLATLFRRNEVRCAECGVIAATAPGWKAYLSGGFEVEPVEVVVFCPACTEREFGKQA
jgi:hypothetical protein